MNLFKCVIDGEDLEIISLLGDLVEMLFHPGRHFNFNLTLLGQLPMLVICGLMIWVVIHSLLLQSSVSFDYPWEQTNELVLSISPLLLKLDTRWVQWGAFSPVFRPHCTKDANNDRYLDLTISSLCFPKLSQIREFLSRRIWVYPWPYSQIMKEAFHLRSRLVPYLYTQARHTHDSGITFLYPLYYDYPGRFHNKITSFLSLWTFR